uniref:ORF147 n=2 Tax=Saccharolobus islandicus TaxID=43080 RepID=Q9C4V2_SACIS|nr:ORF147 [Sulfolobus islandicus]
MMIRQSEILVDPVYTFVEDKVRRFESVLERRIPEHIIAQITYDLKQLYKNNAKYKYSVTAIIALLYYYKIIRYKEALQLLSIYSRWKKRFKEVLKLKRKDKVEKKKKIICPKCGREGYLVVGGNYMYVSHYINKTTEKCYIGRLKNT